MFLRFMTKEVEIHETPHKSCVQSYCTLVSFVVATSGDEGRAALMREIGLGKVIGDSPQPNIVQFIGCVTTQSKDVIATAK